MGRSLLALLVAPCAILLHTSASAATSEFQITPRAGLGSLKIDANVGLNAQRSNADTYGLGATIGYLTPVGVVVEIGADNFSDLDLFGTFDNVSLTQEFASLGYQFELGEGWRLVPRVGRAHWKLHTREGHLFNPGPEEERDVTGNGYFWEIGIARRISRVVSLGVSLKQGQYDFGRTQSAAFTVTLGF